MRQVAISGIGLVSPLGDDIDEVFAAARDGRSAIHRLDIPFSERLVAPLAATSRFDATAHFDKMQQRMLDRFSLFAVHAANNALSDSNAALANLAPERGGVFIGTGMGGTLSMDEGYRTLYAEASDRIKPFTVLMGMHNAAAAWIGMAHALRGPSMTYSTACSSAAVAIGEAWRRVAHGELDVALAGGSEAPLSLGSLKAWEALRTLATIDEEEPSASCRPFSKERSGMVLGEGAAILVLEPLERAIARGARVHGEILGYGLSNDVTHITRPSVAGQAAAIRAALESAELPPEAIDAINAHGTGTEANDATETAAVKDVFGERAGDIPISATKALHGHLLGAAGALECVLALQAMRHAVALPTMHLREPDPACDLDYVPNEARVGVAARVTLSNSFAFGGTNAVLALGAVY